MHVNAASWLAQAWGIPARAIRLVRRASCIVHRASCIVREADRLRGGLSIKSVGRRERAGASWACEWV